MAFGQEMNMHRNELRAYLDELLESARFRDYCPNGLQVEGRDEVRRIVCGVTASQALLDEAVRRDADAVLVHHGWFWKGEDSRITGIRRSRMATLLCRDISLFAYHLPLDAHPELGNNAQLARLAGWRVDGRFAEQDIGFIGAPGAPATAAEIALSLERLLGRAMLVIGAIDKPVARLAWCSGGAQGLFEQAIDAGADCFISGEISEQTVHVARESGVPYIAAGHHASERFGVTALGVHLQEKFGLDCQFVEIDNPV
jgi:dinuclear metal center YbgI/SA1388 family protein